MRKALLAALLLAIVAGPLPAQTNAANGMQALDARNAGVCDNWDKGPNCTDAQVRDAWCDANNKPAGAMCVASDTRKTEDRILTVAEYGAYLSTQAADAATARLAKARRRTMTAL